MLTEEIMWLLLSLSQNEAVPAKGHLRECHFKEPSVVRDEISVLLSIPKGYANKSRLCDSQLNNKYLQEFVEKHSTQWQKQTKNCYLLVGHHLKDLK